MRSRRERMRLCCALVLASSAACGTQPALDTTQVPAPRLAQQPAQAPTQPTGPTDPSKPLEGRWQVVLTLDPLSMHNPPVAERVTGELAFGTGAWWGSADRFGRHSVDLRPFFGRMLAGPDGVTPFSASDTSMVTEVSGSINGDSVGIDFIPRIDHIGISFWGRFYGDSATGSWRRRGMEGSGRFWLKRVSKEPVNVAAIPVYRQISPAPVAVASNPPAAKDDAKAKGSTAARGKSAKTAGTRSASAKAGTTKAATAKTLAEAPAKATPTAAGGGTSGTSVANVSSGSNVSGAAVPAPNAGGTPPDAAAAAKPVPPTSSGQSSASTTTVAASAPASTTPARTLTTNVSNPPTPTPAADPKAMGTVRVRTLDKSSNKYFATKYSLHLPDGRWMYGTLRTNATGEGWGAPLPRMPGHYELEITDFMCGDKIWFLKDKIVKPIDVQPGQQADVTIELDVANAPARKSLDNPTGAKCSEGPGAVK